MKIVEYEHFPMYHFGNSKFNFHWEETGEENLKNIATDIISNIMTILF